MKGTKVKGRASKTWDIGPIKVRGALGWRLRRDSDTRSNAKKRKIVVSTLRGWRSDYVLPLIVDVIRRQGYDAKSLSARVRPYLLTEEEGYRLALALRLVKRTKSLRRVEGLVSAIRGFEPEEAYLWYSYLARAVGNGKETRLTAALAGLGEALW